jgi:hypothetical protein
VPTRADSYTVVRVKNTREPARSVMRWLAATTLVIFTTSSVLPCQLSASLEVPAVVGLSSPERVGISTAHHGMGRTTAERSTTPPAHHHAMSTLPSAEDVDHTSHHASHDLKLDGAPVHADAQVGSTADGRRTVGAHELSLRAPCPCGCDRASALAAASSRLGSFVPPAVTVVMPESIRVDALAFVPSIESPILDGPEPVPILS